MCQRHPDLPFLPGFTINPNLGKTKFNLDPQFVHLGPGIRALKEKVKPNMLSPMSDKYPSLYPRGEVLELPAWICFDKQILQFDAFFQETLQEVRCTPYIVRKVKIYFFLEDGTIQVIEPKVKNSGISQGTLIARTRIRFPEPMSENFYDILDFNIGREVEFFGRVFKITNCDQFTRQFLNRCGIAVPDPITSPSDPYDVMRSKEQDCFFPKKPNRFVDSRGKFLENDRKVLRFKAYWDDRKTEFGYIHNLEVLFYLADDTIEINEKNEPKSGLRNFCFLSRTKLPKDYKGLPVPGEDAPNTILNVLGSTLNRRFTVDPLDCGKKVSDFYTEKDFSIGGTLNCYGRNIVLIDCDNFTKDYFSKNYGLEELIPIDAPNNKKEKDDHKIQVKQLPPWNGFGGYEDSAQNCINVAPKPPHRDFKKFLAYDRIGMDSHILRFEARLVSKIPEYCSRIFIVSYFLSDDTIKVSEIARANSGFKTSCFFSRRPVKLPGQRVYTSEPPLKYTPQHMFVGATLIINGFQFVLINADEYSFRFMELNPQKYPKANIKLIMENVRERLRPIYRDFIAENIPTETPTIPYTKLRAQLCKIMGEEFTEHEMITIARAFTAVCTEPRYNREKIRALALTELKRFLWDDWVRLREYMLKRDPTKTGVLSRKDVCTVLKACRIPFDPILIDKILDVCKTDENCNIYYMDCLNFLDRRIDPPSDVEPVNVKSELWWGLDRDADPTLLIDWCEFNKYLDLEDTFKQPITDQEIKNLEEKNLI
ncbi:EF-hand domain-containing family member C2-like [Aethina tumida]|uniref:EF-hand domain-containing family member C2-like n=1 Tax=Aethina tumida TaxID=116153 RepID=UPI00096AECAD|nr:EF-hand domain-containing family member C2-like [Aethina tumida]